MTTTRVRIFYPADPVGVVPGGIDTFLRGIIKWAPSDIDFSLVGMTTDTHARPAGRRTRCQIGGREFDFHPVVTVNDAGARGKIPLSVRFMAGTWRQRDELRAGFDVFDFHRAEPSLLFASDQRPKNAYFHQDPKIVRMDQSDNLWKHLPGVYERIESRAAAKLSSAWCVRESGVQTLRERYPTLASRIQFIPTWVDTDVFHAIDEGARQTLRREMALTHRMDEQAQWVVTIGRLDTQKDPMLMLAAFARLRAQGHRVEWIVIGDGVLRKELERGVLAAGLGAVVHFLGLRPPAEISDVLRAADVFALSSAYEGMPMALLEALGCGVPAVVTDVGEVRRVVHSGVNGAVAVARDEVAFAKALADVLEHAVVWGGLPAQLAVDSYQPGKVLAVAYDNYRTLGEDCARVRRTGLSRESLNSKERLSRGVIGVPIDLLDRAGVSAKLLIWAKANESRIMCFVNVHSAVQASHDERHRLTLLGADLVAPDGAPIAWTLRLKGHRQQQRVDGPGMMWRLCADAQTEGVKIGLYGSSPDTLRELVEELKQAFPLLDISYAFSPPFRDLSVEEDQAVCSEIAQAGVGLLFVGLGCPKQEFWMAQHRGAYLRSCLAWVLRLSFMLEPCHGRPSGCGSMD